MTDLLGPQPLRDDRLTLLAGDAPDLGVISGLMQDAIVRAGDVGWDRRHRRLVLIASRFCWETTTPSRVRTALRLETAQKVERQRWPTDPDTVLALLSVSADDDRISLVLADGVCLRVTTECIDVVLEDLSPPWPVRHRPHHTD